MSTTSLRDTYAINRPAVVSELIDGETVMMNLETGEYFSARGTASSVWSWLEAGLQPTEIADSLAACYAGERQPMEAALAGFLESLLQHGLILPAPSAAAGLGTPRPSVAAPAERPSFAPPVLEVYSDMRDLLFLDPIHDVDETGWPAAAVADRQPG